MPEAELSTTGLYIIDTSLSNDTNIRLPIHESTLTGHSYIIKNLQNWITVGFSNGTYISEISTPLYYRTPRITGWNVLGPYPGPQVNAQEGLSTCTNYLVGGTIYNILQTKGLTLGDDLFFVSSGYINASVNQIYFDFSQLTDGLSTSFLTAQLISTQTIEPVYTTTVPDISTLQLSTGTATFSTIQTTQGLITLSTNWFLYDGQGLKQFTSTMVLKDSYQIESLQVSSATILNTLCNQPNVLSTLSIAFTQADQTVYPSSQTTFLPIDTSLFPGVLELPAASSVTGYFVTIQDLANTFPTNPLTLSTVGVDLFFPQLTPICNLTTSKNLTLVATADNLWRTVREYQQSSFYTFQPTYEQTSSFTTSSVQTTSFYAPTICQTQSFTFS